MKKTVLLILGLAIIISAIACGDPDTPESAAITITAGDKKYVVTMDDMLAFKPSEVLAYPRDEERRFTGVSLISVFDRVGIDYSNMKSVNFTAADGFGVELAADEVLNTKNTFIVITEDNEPLGHYDEDGSGPFMVVLAEDPFPNRWVRNLVEISIVT